MRSSAIDADGEDGPFRVVFSTLIHEYARSIPPKPSPARAWIGKYTACSRLMVAQIANLTKGGQREPDMIMAFTGILRVLNRSGSSLEWRSSWSTQLVALLLRWPRTLAGPSAQRQQATLPDPGHATRKPGRPNKLLLALDERTLSDIGIDRQHALWLTYVQPRRRWWRRR